MSSKQTSQITKKYHIWFHWSLTNIQFVTKTSSSIVTTSFLSSFPPQTLLKKKFPSSTAVLCLFLQQSVDSTKCGWKSAICVGLVQHNELHQNQFQQEKLRPKPLPLAVLRLKQHQRPDCNEPGNQPTNQPSQAIANEHWPTIHPTEISTGKAGPKTLHF